MSINRNRTRYNQVQTSREYCIESMREEYPPYWDDGINFYPQYRRGFKNPNKRIQAHHMRMYKTWKHNRNKQWKTIN